MRAISPSLQNWAFLAKVKKSPILHSGLKVPVPARISSHETFCAYKRLLIKWAIEVIVKRMERVRELLPLSIMW